MTTPTDVIQRAANMQGRTAVLNLKMQTVMAEIAQETGIAFRTQPTLTEDEMMMVLDLGEELQDLSSDFVAKLTAHRNKMRSEIREMLNNRDSDDDADGV